MNMPFSINLEPIFFTTTQDPWLPQYQPYDYQYRVLTKVTAAIEQGKTVCIFLVTPTGSGKTLASYAYSILHNMPTIGIYPTNELIRDQETNLEKEYQRMQGLSKPVLRIDSQQLDEWEIDLEQTSHADALEIIINWQKVVLTNPDILYFLAFGRYPERSHRVGQRRRLLESLAQYPIWVFDEFHLYNVKQSANIAFLASALHAINPNKGRVFIFASATPELEARFLLEDRLSLDVTVIEAKQTNSDQQRIVAHPIVLTLVPANLNQWKGIDTIINNLTLLHDFVNAYPEARVITIVDSVTGAMHLANTLKSAFADKSVGEIHGFSSDEERTEALRKQITVGTSTIEVGIDLKDETEKDMLIFEARTSSQFIQRLGRVGRHSKHKNIPNKVIAVIPDYVYNAVTTALAGQTSVTRANLYEKLEEAYRVPETFSRYLKKHAIVEMTEGKRFISGLFQADNKQDIMQTLDANTEALTKLSSGVGWARWNDYREKGTIYPLLTFRGTNFDAAIIDNRGTDSGFPIKRYNLLFLLRRSEFEELSEAAFQMILNNLKEQNPEAAKLADREASMSQPIGRKSSDLLGVYGFFRLDRLLKSWGRKVYFEIDEDDAFTGQEQVVCLSGIELRTEPSMRAPLMMKRLRKKDHVVWFTNRHPSSLKLGRQLPHLFEVFELRVRGQGGQLRESKWSIAFGQNAFFLDSLYWKPVQNEPLFV